MRGCFFFFLTRMSSGHCWKVCLIEQIFPTLCMKVLHCVQWGWHPLYTFFFPFTSCISVCIEQLVSIVWLLHVYNKVVANGIAAVVWSLHVYVEPSSCVLYPLVPWRGDQYWHRKLFYFSFAVFSIIFKRHMALLTFGRVETKFVWQQCLSSANFVIMQYLFKKEFVEVEYFMVALGSQFLSIIFLSI